MGLAVGVGDVGNSVVGGVIGLDVLADGPAVGEGD